MLNVVAPLVVMSTGCWQLNEIVFIRKRFILLNGATTFSIMTFSITTLSITTFNAYAVVSICRMSFKLSATINYSMLSVVNLNAVRLNVVAPSKRLVFMTS
jgi:hypothetical protein